MARNVDKHGQATGLVPLFCLLVVGGSIGLTNNLAKLGTAYGLPPLALLFWSVLGAALLLVILAIGARRPPALNRRTQVYGLVSGLLLMALPTSIIYLAAPHVGSGFVSLSLAFVPLITYLLAVLLRIEGNRWVRLAGVFAGLAGALLLALSKSRAPDAEPIWIVATLAIPVTIAVGNIYRTLQWPPGAASLSLAPLMLAGAGLWLLPFAASGAGTVVTSGPGLALTAVQAAVFTLTYSLYFILQRIAGAVYLSQIGSVGAVTGAAIAVIGFRETLPPGFIAAAVLIVAGVALFNVRTKLA
jgi:drug/metabolite transporter (DMT)-like permease